MEKYLKSSIIILILLVFTTCTESYNNIKPIDHMDGVTVTIDSTKVVSLVSNPHDVLKRRKRKQSINKYFYVLKKNRTLTK